VAAQQFARYAHPAGMDLTIAGVVPREAVGILVRALWPVIVSVNATLLAFHLAVGGALGALAARFWEEGFRLLGRRLSRRLRWLLVSGSLLLIVALAFSTVVVRYPFQYDHLLNARGGLPRQIQQALTAHAHPDLLELATWGAIALLALPALARATRRRPVAAVAVVVAALGLAGWNASRPAPGLNQGPNVVLILLESARGDHFSVNGYPRPTSPRLDRLVAEAGVTFTNAWAHANGTVESVVTILTSAYSHRHGIRSMFHNEDFAAPGVPTLPAWLRARGYATRVVTDWDGDVTYFNERVLPGFDRYDVAEFGVVNYVKQIYAQYFVFYALTDNRLGHRAFSSFYHAGGGFAPAGSDAYYRARIESHLGELARTGRFFLMLFFSNAHMNYRCPHPYYSRFGDPAYEGPSKYQAMANPLALSPAGHEEEARQVAALYAGCISALDDNIGFVADTLRRLGLDRRTIMVITGDHGDRLPDRQSFRYGRNGAWLDPAEFHVPLVVVAPSVEVARRRVGAPARHVDIMPTILQLIGLPAPTGLDGVGLVPLITGTASNLGTEVFGEATFHWTPVGPPYLGYPPMTEVVELRVDPRGSLIPQYFLRPDCVARINLAKHRFVRTERYQLNHRPTESGSVIELYDWTVDPHGQRDLATARADVAGELRARLFGWALGDPDLALGGGQLVARDPRAAGCAPHR
jgi:arylsulfatase A-like enzyme